MPREAKHEPSDSDVVDQSVVLVGAGMGNLTVITLAVAALSLLGNAWQSWAYLHLRDELTLAQQAVKAMERERDTARGEAADCSDAVDDLRDLADQRAKEASTARATAAAQAHAAAQRADRILAAPAAVPGNDCASAQVRVEHWLQTRPRP